MNDKPRLIIIEGFDRTGKDTLLKKFDEKHKGDQTFRAYFQFPPKDIPRYREQPEAFRQWLIGWIGNQIDELIHYAEDGAKTQMIVRLLLTDKVYSTLFNREEVVNRFHEKVFEHFQVENHVFLFKDYDAYLRRLELIGDNEKEYSEEEFVKVNDLYYDTAEFFEGLGAKTKFYYISGDEFLDKYLDTIEESI